MTIFAQRRGLWRLMTLIMIASLTLAGCTAATKPHDLRGVPLESRVLYLQNGELHTLALNGSATRVLASKVRAGCAPLGRPRCGGYYPGCHGPAAARLGGIGAGWRGRRRPHPGWRQGQLRLPLRPALDGAAPQRRARATPAVDGAGRPASRCLGRLPRNELPQGKPR